MTDAQPGSTPGKVLATFVAHKRKGGKFMVCINYEKQVNEIKDIIRSLNTDNPSMICGYLAGYIPEAPIGVCVDAIFSLLNEKMVQQYWTKF